MKILLEKGTLIAAISIKKINKVLICKNYRGGIYMFVLFMILFFIMHPPVQEEEKLAVVNDEITEEEYY